MADAPSAPAPLGGSAQRALHALAESSGAPGLRGIQGDELLMERARQSGLRFTSGVSAGGSCRLLRVRDRTVAVSLPRQSDWDVVPAWLETQRPDPWSWPALAEAVRERRADELVERARVLGIAIASAAAPSVPAPPFHRISGAPLPAVRHGPASSSRPPLVIDLSALWAGPLATHLLHLCGAEVVKVESLHRPDGARRGNAAFYRVLNQGKHCVALDFEDPAGRRALRALLDKADVVIESSRPRALRQLGIDATALVQRRPALTWVSITGHGREEPQDNWIAFGDDAGVAAGLSEIMRTATGAFQFAGDAIADPLVGIRAALAAWQSWRAGGSRLIALSLADVAAASLDEEQRQVGAARVARTFGAWWDRVRDRQPPVAARSRPVTEPVGALGEHTVPVLSRLGIAC